MRSACPTSLSADTTWLSMPPRVESAAAVAAATPLLSCSETRLSVLCADAESDMPLVEPPSLPQVRAGPTAHGMTGPRQQSCSTASRTAASCVSSRQTTPVVPPAAPVSASLPQAAHRPPLNPHCCLWSAFGLTSMRHMLPSLRTASIGSYEALRKRLAAIWSILDARVHRVRRCTSQLGLATWKAGN